MKDYQTIEAARAVPLPESVRLAVADIVGTMREGLLARAVTAGLGVMTALVEESVSTVSGPKGKHLPDRAAVRHGSEDGSVALGGRRAPVRRPRATAHPPATIRTWPEPATDRHRSSTELGTSSEASRGIFGLDVFVGPQPPARSWWTRGVTSRC